MSTNSAPSPADPPLCRVTVVAPHRRADIAFPTGVALAELLPEVLRQIDGHLAESGLEHGGWALQRLGEPPLDIAGTASDLGLRDGDMLYLRPRRNRLPAPVYDDVADAVQSTLAQRDDRWTARSARRAGLLAAVAFMAVGGSATLFIGPPWTFSAIYTSIVAIAALLAGGALSRAYGDGAAGTVIAASAAPYAFLAGLEAMSAGQPHLRWTVAAVLTGSAAAAAAAAVGGVLVGAHVDVLGGLGVAAACGAVGCAAGLAADAATAAGITVTIVLALGPLAPALAYRLAGLPGPALPPNAAALRRDAFSGFRDELTPRVTLADALLTAACLGGAIAAGLAAVPLARTRGWAGPLLCLLAAVALALRSRTMSSGMQRWSLLGGAMCAYAAAAFRIATGGRPALALAACAVVTVFGVAGALAAARRTAPRALAPTEVAYPRLGRLADLAETVALLAAIPVLLQVLGVYAYVRDLMS